MELTSKQRLLLNGLDLFGVDKDAMVLILTALQEDTQMDELMTYMTHNPKATEEDLLEKTAEINKSAKRK